MAGYSQIILQLSVVDYLSILLALYLSLSILLFLFPTILHTKRDYKQKEFIESFQKNRFLVIGHRGASRLALENTMDSFTTSTKYSNILEMDVCETKDKQLIVCHDPKLTRLCGVDKYVKEYNYEELPAFKDQVSQHFSDPLIYVESNKLVHRMPKLDEVFGKYPQMYFNIELKTPSPQSIVEMYRLIQKHNMQQKVTWGVKYQEYRDTIHQVCKIHGMQQFFTLQSCITVFFSFLVGLLPFISFRENSLQFPLYTDEHYRWKMNTTSGSEKRICQVELMLIRMFNAISRPIFWHLQRRGIVVFYWVLNSVEDYQQAIDQNVNGIMSDNPKLLYEYLQTKNMLIKNTT